MAVADAATRVASQEASERCVMGAGYPPPLPLWSATAGAVAAAQQRGRGTCWELRGCARGSHRGSTSQGGGGMEGPVKPAGRRAVHRSRHGPPPPVR